ncbi:MAG: hypothetical protein ACR2JW_00645 [Thermomicrobiales bacterium]
MMEPRTVSGRELLPLGIVAGRAIYRLTSQGEGYRLTPDIRAGYLLRRESDGYSGVFDNLETAVAYIATLEQQEQ